MDEDNVQSYIKKVTDAVTGHILNSDPVAMDDDVLKGLTKVASRNTAVDLASNSNNSNAVVWNGTLDASIKPPARTGPAQSTVTCSICFAEVKTNHSPDHLAWHNEMNEIMDKVGMGRPFPGLR